MVRSRRRLFVFFGSVLATVGVIVGACFVFNCLVDPLWYLRGNLLTHINYPFNERLSKIVRLWPRLHDYDCLILGTSRATLLPEDQIAGHRCYNLAFSDGQSNEFLLYAKYLRAQGFAPSLLIVEIRRSELIGPDQPLVVPDFVRSAAPPPSIFATYLSFDAFDFSLRTLRGDAPHHRFYDADFHAELEVRSKRHAYKPEVPIKPEPAPVDVHPERAERYAEIRRQFPEARAIGYLPLESAWRIAAFSLTGQLDRYLGAIGQIAAAYDRFLDFSIASPLAASRQGTYDGIHYSRQANEPVAAALVGEPDKIALDWHREQPAAIADVYHRRLAEFITAQAEAGQKR